MKFVNRARELAALEAFQGSDRAGLFILFGRRRVGKTRLLTYFLEKSNQVPSLYWTATTHSSAYQLRDFSQALMRFDPRFGQPPTEDFAFRDWEAALEHLAAIVDQADNPQFIVLDEFTHLTRNDPAIPSVFQKMWDHRLCNLAHLRLILTGSLVGMMEREVISYQAPLYGRATSLLRLRPLPYASLLELFPDRSPVERVVIYAVTGGVPAYLDLFTQASDFKTALYTHGLGTSSLLLADPALILHEQLREPQSYESILSAIAGGHHQWKGIARMAGLSESSLGHYLKILQELELIERRDPVLASPRGRAGRYHVRDQFLRFYYRFIVPHITAIERGYLDTVVDRIETDLRAFIGTHIFEELCREWVYAAAAGGQLDFQPEVVGAYWGRPGGKGVQLDVVAASRREKRLLIGEAKWGRGRVGRSILTDLIARSQRMPQVGQGWTAEYAVFARWGFTDAAKAATDKQGARLITLKEMERALAAAESPPES